MLVDGGLAVRTPAVGRVEEPIEFRHNFVSKGADARGVPLSIAHRYTSVCIAGLIINDHPTRKSSAIGRCRNLEGICRSALWAQPDMGRPERDRRWLP